MTPAVNFRDAFADPEYFKLCDEEAAFGFSEIAPIVASLGARGLKCLEIGSGPGLLLARLQASFPDCRFEGLEPVGSGFGKTEAPLAAITARAGLIIHRRGYEDFEGAGGYDLIFSINVFEHVASWRDYLTRSRAWLARGGRSVILCPNYAFPWEPHFRIPIALDKALTYRLFARAIENYERSQDYAGLWTSLNFVTKRQVLAFARATGIRLVSDETIMRRMFARLFTDPAFAGRQRRLAGLAKALYGAGLTRALEWPGVRYFAPFMALSVFKE